jgi:hypothetical protein
LRLEGLESRDLLSIFVVNTLNDSLAVPGSLSLRDAITQANAAGGGNTITFAVTGTISLDNAAGALPTIRDDLIIQGPGAGSLTLQRPSSAAEFRIFDIARAFTVTISGLTISGGRESSQGGGIRSFGTLTVQNVTLSNNSAGTGGGIDNEGPLFTLIGSTISGNTATNRGGGVASTDYGGSVTIQDSSITGNSASGDRGGGFYSDAGDITVRNSTISNNTVQGSGGTAGGGISTRSSALTIENSTISGNHAISSSEEDAEGGGISGSGGATVLTNTTISGNSAIGAGAGRGGGLFSNQTLSMTGCTISGNTATSTGDQAEGGGIYSRADTTFIQDTTISGNTAGATNSEYGTAHGRGGGIFSKAKAVLIQNTTLTGNVASSQSADAEGGAIYLYTNALLTRNVTIATNQANGVEGGGAGGGIFVSDTPDAVVTLTNTIVATNTTPSPGNGPDINGHIVSADHDLIGVVDSTASFDSSVGNLTGTQASPLDPVLGPLADNGGPTHTIPLQSGSPAIDAGDDSVLSNNPLTSDQRETPFVRFFGSHVDIGAFEVQPPNATSPPIPPLSSGHTFVVNTLNDTLGVPGSFSLRDAITAANAAGGGNLITFTVTGTIALTNPAGGLPAITNDLDIEGPGASSLTVQRPSAAVPFSVFSVAPGFVATIAGLTITGGQAPGDTGPASAGGGINNLGALTVQNAVISGNTALEGGGLYSYGPALTVLNSTISNNSATITNGISKGGGISIEQGIATIRNSTVSNNTSLDTSSSGSQTAEGGGVYILEATVTIQNTMISGNSARQPSPSGGGEGGAVYNEGGLVTIENSTITGNTATGGRFGEGGGLYSDVGIFRISGTTISGNTASGGQGEGGGIYNDAGTYSLDSCTISGNMAIGTSQNGEGGGVYVDVFTIIIKNSTISGNTATSTGPATLSSGNGEGGGIYVDAGAVVLQNSTVTGNTASSQNGNGLGGGVYFDTGSLTVRNSTIASNQANGPGEDTGGGGIETVLGGSGDFVTLTNTILATNTTSNPGNGPDLDGNVASGNHSLIGILNSAGSLTVSVSNLTGTDISPLDPMLGALANNGGPTQTMALLMGSPAVDAGDDNVLTNNPITTDQRGAGFPRLVGAHVDMGAFEEQEAACVTVVTNTNDSGPGTLRAAIECANMMPGLDTITFLIPGAGVQVIRVFSALPAITDPVIIDGYSQPGAHPNTNGISLADNAVLLIVVDGSSIGTDPDGLTIVSGHSTIQGLVIGGFDGNGIVLTANGGNIITGNFIGTNAAATAVMANTMNGVEIENTANNTIGGTTPAARNIISGNGRDGVLITGVNATGNQVQGNFIGTDITGTMALANDTGVELVSGASHNNVGGDAGTASRNIISGNGGNGIFISSDDPQAPVTENTITGNFIGVDISGAAGLPNLGNGILISGAASDNLVLGNVISANGGDGIRITNTTTLGLQAPTANSVELNVIGANAAGNAALGNRIGVLVERGSSANAIVGNLISGNTQDGVTIRTDELGNVTTANLVAGNFIGTDLAGTMALANEENGVTIAGGSNNAVRGNIISGNSGDGVQINPFGGEEGVFVAMGNVVEGNRIGTNAAGTAALSNIGNGVSVEGDNNSIGGTTAGAGNLVAFNEGAGVVIRGGTGNGILSNSIFSNGALGIDLGDDGVTLNDSAGHVGPNNFQSFPVLTSATTDGVTEIKGTLDSTPNTTFTVQCFSNVTPDPTGFGEGATLLATVSVSTDSQGHTSFDVTAPAVPAGHFISATATDPSNNTSEFAADIQVVSVTPPVRPIATVVGKINLIGSNLTDPMQDLVAQSFFVDQVYQNLLGRMPEQSGLNYWVTLLQSGFPRTAVTVGIWQSPEHRGIEVDHYYQTFLHRQADPVGRAGWVGALVAGASETDVELAFLNSPEYLAQHVSDSAFVDALYADVLGRPADADGSAGWIHALESGMSREAAALQILTSAEADRRAIDGFYTSFLHRPGDAVGEQGWLGLVQSGRGSLEVVAESILASDEYFFRAQS